MKIAVLSDIHGNVPALTAVIDDILRWQPDQIIVNGDVVNRGPYSKKVLEMLQSEIPKATLLSGNHESFVIHCADNIYDPEHEKYDMQCFAQWSAEQIGSEWIEKIKQWGNHVDLNDLEGGSSFHVTHGSRIGNRDGISARTNDEDLPAKLGEPRDLFVASHTHKAMVRYFNGNIVVNTGSVGQPLDDDARASYGKFTFIQGKWQVNIARVEYDKVQAEKDFHESGFLEAGGPLAQLMYLEHQNNTMYVGPFMRKYSDRIKENQITLANAVKAFLSDS